ncbi:OLC1v1013190C1 [Oldenlandia corymbosa var. corymbosa]|uniref:OLC1v1013190C1 n=1 Tax=Oldenlandia corymbosa var. corymbosa TaxID=529605 RepID=A0AAV1DZQ9_OLDCO|nr:OLC1v1013190C1 [Oldenlandia corymbosa var. corymbosa]
MARNVSYMLNLYHTSKYVIENGSINTFSNMPDDGLFVEERLSYEGLISKICMTLGWDPAHVKLHLSLIFDSPGGRRVVKIKNDSHVEFMNRVDPMSCLDLYIDLEDITQEEREASLENVSFGDFRRGERASTSRNRDEEETPLFAQNDYREESDSDYIAPSESEEDCDVSGESDFEESDDERLENEERDCNLFARRHVYSKMGNWDASFVDKDEFALKMWDETPEGMDIGVCFKSQSEAKHAVKLWNIHHKREYTVAASSPRTWAVRCRTFNVESEDGEPPCEWKMRVSLKTHGLHEIVRWHDAHNCMTPVNDNENRIVSVISDRNAGLLSAMSQMDEWRDLGDGGHFLCLRHVRSNLVSRYNSKKVKRLCWKMGTTLSRVKYNRMRREVIEFKPAAWEYLRGIGGSNWARLKAGLRRWGIATTNISESYNNALKGIRFLPIRALIDATFRKTVKFYREEQLSARNCMTPIPPELWKKYEKMNDKAASFEATPFDGDDAMWRVVTATRLSGRGGSLHTVNYDEHRIEMATPASSSQYDYQPKHLHPDLYKIKCYIVKQSIGPKLSMRTGYRTLRHSASRAVVSRTADEWRDRCEAYLGFRPAIVNGQCVNVGIFEDEMGRALPSNSTCPSIRAKGRTLILHFISSFMFRTRREHLSIYGSWPELRIWIGVVDTIGDRTAGWVVLGLCEASQYTMHDATGCLYLLQVWASAGTPRITQHSFSITPTYAIIGIGEKSSCYEIWRKEILEFKESLIDHANRLSSWIGQNCCNWNGITCDNLTGHVEKIDLRNPIQPKENNCLGGNISSSLLNLNHLIYLDLSSNNFSGIPIPENRCLGGFCGEIPFNLGNLSNLQHLDLGYPSVGWSDMCLSAKNLNWAARLTSLKDLNLCGIDLSECVDWFGSVNMLPSLSSLNLRKCDLPSDPLVLPSHFNLTSIVSLDIGYNYNFNLELTSVLPWLFNFTNDFEVLKLDGLDLKGPIPFMVEKFISLSDLDISYNNFYSSSLLDSLCNHTSLVSVNLFVNLIEGSLPLCLGNLTSLRVLNLGSNQFGGKLPSWLGQLGNLTYLDLSGNDFRSFVPSSFGKLRELEYLHLDGNQLYGLVPEALGQLNKLEELDISFNLLSAELSEFHFVELKRLKHLDLSYNPSLTLNVSSQWIPPFRLEYIGMHSVRVGSQIPQWLRTQNSVTSLLMSNASISGSIPEWFVTACSSVQELDLSKNDISGVLPSSLKNMNSLSNLNLSSNRLTGNLPEWIGGITQLQALSLQSNNFYGELPPSLTKLKYLSDLDLSENQFTGTIPEWIGEQLTELYTLKLHSNNFYVVSV